MKVVSYDPVTLKQISLYESALEAERETGANYQVILRCCKRETSTAGGLIWRYAYDTLEPLRLSKSEERKVPVVCYMPDSGMMVREFDTITKAAKTYDLNASRISECCRGERFKVGDFVWRFKGEPYDPESAPKAFEPNKTGDYTYCPITQIDITTGEVTHWKHLYEAVYNKYKKTGVKRVTLTKLLTACQSNNHLLQGCIWSYDEEPKGYFERYLKSYH